MVDGWEDWRRKLPAYRGKRLVVLPLVVLGSMLAGQAYLIGLESLPLLLPRGHPVGALEPVLPPIATGTLLVAGFLSITQLWARRERYLAESRATAYQRALPFGLVGIGLLMAVILNGFVPVYQVAAESLQHPLSRTFARPVIDIVPGDEPGGWAVRGGLGLVVFGLGTLQAVRSVQTFGIDNATLVYLYYPEESEMADHAIYSVIRHPIYTGWLLWMAGGTVFRLSLYGFLDFGAFFVALVVWLRRVEEAELIDRFGDEYREYRRDVPAFFPRPGELRMYLAFLLGRE